MVVSALVMLSFAATLTTIGFFVDPKGEVHDSVLWILGQALMYAGSIFGIGAYANGKLRHIQESVDRSIENRFRAYEDRYGKTQEPTEEEKTESEEE